jgi:hypothetical protein
VDFPEYLTSGRLLAEYLTSGRLLADGRMAWVVPLTFGRARLIRGTADLIDDGY